MKEERRELIQSFPKPRWPPTNTHWSIPSPSDLHLRLSLPGSLLWLQILPRHPAHISITCSHTILYCICRHSRPPVRHPSPMPPHTQTLKLPWAETERLIDVYRIIGGAHIWIFNILLTFLALPSFYLLRSQPSFWHKSRRFLWHNSIFIYLISKDKKEWEF